MKETELAIPHLFRCPISLDLFTDPVTLCTGQTYDRSSIEKWLAAGNLTCPVTMQKLHDPSIVPNHTLRHLIDQWLQSGHQIHHEFLKMIDPDGSLAALKHNLESQESSLETKLLAVEKVLLLSQELTSQNSCLVQLGFFPLLLQLAFKKVEGENFDETDLNFIEQALVCALKWLPFSDLGTLNMLQEEPKLASFMVLLDQGNIKIKKSLCHLVEAVSSSIKTKKLSAMLGKNSTILKGMVQLVPDNSDASEAGIKAMLALCSMESNRENLVREGAVQSLITCILGPEKRERSSPSSMAMALIELLLVVESAKRAVINHPRGVHALVKMIFRVSDHGGSESAVNSLLIICCDSIEAREEAICAGVLTQLLLLLQSQCIGRAKTKARMLLKLLR